ncbi:DUF3631 domain-containing protein [Nocardia brasiliensis]|uniref:DUF3631 domain-containing protein n=1 Tax=Nocardia brasiliensis TaxID=37326 RepID=UPI003D8CCAD1
MSVPDYDNASVARLDGAAVLDEVRTMITRYCVLPSPQAVDAVSLWVATTHLVSAFDYAPRLVIRSPEKRSGKSRLLEVVDAMVCNPLRTVNASVPYVFRSLGTDQLPTLLFDEADTIFGSKRVAENNEDLRGLLNAGFQRGMTCGRIQGPTHQPVEFQTFAMAALAGIGRMPDTIEDRAVVVVMRRRKPDEKVAPFRARRDSTRLNQTRDALADWAEQVETEIRGREPADLGVEDRAADVWEPLITVADMAGGHWPATARAAAVFMVADAEDDNDTTSPNLRLLADIREVFTRTGLSFIKSQALCDYLHAMDESPWGEWALNPSKLGHRLKEYGVRTSHSSDKSERGYRSSDFRDAFDRYLPPVKASQPVQPVQQATDLRQPPDIFTTPDTSPPPKASTHTPSSNRVDTASDGSGHLFTVQAPNADHQPPPTLPGDRTCPMCGNTGSEPVGAVCRACCDAGNYPTQCAHCGKPLPPKFRYDRHHACRTQAVAA